MADAIFVELDGYLGPPKAKGLKPAPGGGSKKKETPPCGNQEGGTIPSPTAFRLFWRATCCFEPTCGNGRPHTLGWLVLHARRPTGSRGLAPWCCKGAR